MRRVWLVVLCLVAPITAQSDAQPFTEIERLRIENVRLERVIVERAVADWQAKVKTLKADIEQARPGYEWNPDTGQLSKMPEKK